MFFISSWSGVLLASLAFSSARATPDTDSLQNTPTPPADNPALVEPAPEPTLPPPRSVQVVYTGASMGIGRHRSPKEMLRLLAENTVPAGAKVTQIQGVHGVLVQGPHTLKVDGTMAAMVAFLDGQPITCTPAPPVLGLRAPTGQLEFDVGGPVPGWLKAIATPDRFQRQICAHPGGVSATLTTDGEAPLPDWTLTAWETRDAVLGTVALAGKSVQFTAVQDPLTDHSRTFHQVESILKSEPNAIYVDAGSALDGASSVRDGGPSLHRTTRLRDFNRLGPAVLVPGETELVLGARAFIDEQTPFDLDYVATNWESSDPLLELPASKVVEVDHPSGTVRIAFIGILDPSMQDIHPGLAAEGVRITDPITAVQPEVARLESLRPAPDAIIALTTARGSVQERIRRELRGVDLLIGDPSLATYRTEAREVMLRSLDSSQKGAAVTLPMDGLATSTLTFDSSDGQLESVRTVPLSIQRSTPVDPEATGSITRVRAEVFPELERPLLGPPPGDNPAQTWSTDQWNQLICEAVRSGTHSDIVLFDELPSPPETPGPVSELQAVERLALADTLEVHRIPGTQIQRLADRLAGIRPVVCGIVPGTYISKLGPRWLDTTRTYRVVTTRRAAATTPIGEVLRSLESSKALDQPTVVPVPSNSDPKKPATLRSVALSELRRLRDEPGSSPTAVIQTLLVDRATTYDPLWLVRVRRIGVQSTSFAGMDDPAFAEVPETLATSPSSYTLGSEADVALEYSGPSIWSDLRTAAAFNRIRAGEEDPEELADDLRFSTSHSLPGLAFPTVPPLRMMPFTEVAYDTEFTPIEEEDGGTGIKQSDLSLTLGIAALRTGAIRALRIGGFVNRDMARLDEKPPEYGGALNWETYKSFGPSVAWSTAANVALYANTQDDDPSDLRLRALGDTRLLLPLATWLDIGIFGQAFAIRGRTPTNDTLGVSTTWGVTLEMDGAFKL